MNCVITDILWYYVKVKLLIWMIELFTSARLYQIIFQTGRSSVFTPEAHGVSAAALMLLGSWLFAQSWRAGCCLIALPLHACHYWLRLSIFPESFWLKNIFAVVKFLNIFPNFPYDLFFILTCSRSFFHLVNSVPVYAVDFICLMFCLKIISV